MADTCYITCEIERGAFTNERTFEVALSERIKLSSGESTGILVGTAHKMHLLDEHKQPLEDDAPQFGSKIKGLVRCQQIRYLKDNWVVIEVPSADLFHVPADELITI